MQNAAISTRKLMRLAESASRKGQHQEAFQLYQQVVTLDPHHAEALFYLGRTLHSAGDYASAAFLYERAIQEDAQHCDSYVSLCWIYDVQHQFDRVMQLAQRATERMPNNPKAFSLMASALIRYGNAHLALDYLEKALQRFTSDSELLQHYCMALKDCNRFAEADEAYQKLVAGKRVPAHFRVQYELNLPRFNQSNEHIDAVRTAFAETVRRFTKEKPQVDLAMLANNPLFALTYHDRDNKEFAISFTRMLRSMAPQLNFVAPHCKAAIVDKTGPVKIGFFSQRMHNHVVGSCYRGVMLHLAQQPDFAVRFFRQSDVMDSGIQQILDAGIPVVALPASITAAQTVMANHQLDILIYPDIGMDMVTHFLAMSRLAPYQLCLGGHPETTGIDTVDYAVASREYEPAHAQTNYTERLLCLDGAATIFKRPAPPQRWFTRADLGLPEDRKLYMCPMAVHKFHPDFDAILSDLLRQDAQATLILFNDFHEQAVTDAFKQRIARSCDLSRIIFMPWQELEAFQSLLKLVDAVLDTIGFGGGTTSHYAFDLGVPIVTLPGRFARGRMVYSYYQVMGIADAPVAASPEDYVRLAVRLAHDRAYYDQLHQLILARSERIFERPSQIDAFTQLIRDVMAQQLEQYAR